MDFKNTLRKEIDKKLSTLNRETILEKSNIIKDNLIKCELWSKNSKIFIYIDFKKEVITRDIIKKAKEDNIEVYAPLIDSKTMSFFRIDNLKEEEMVKNRYGILEPPKGLKEVIPNKNSIMLIPGVSFSKTGERLGRGGGFYDRFLSQHPDIIKVGLTFEIQLSAAIPTESWDKKMDYIITEKSVYKTGV